MAEVTHSQVLAKLADVAAAQHKIHVHVHVVAGVPAPTAPAVTLPAAGAATRKDR